MGKTEKIRDDLYIKKGWDGYRVVYPTKNDLTKPFSFNNINWKNFLTGGHWSYSLKLLIFIMALYFFVQMYNYDTAICREYASNFEEMFKNFSSQPVQPAKNDITLELNRLLNVTNETAELGS